MVSRQLPEADAAKLLLKMETAKSLSSSASRRPNAPNQKALTWFTLATTSQLDAVPQAKAAVERALARWDSVFEVLYPITVRVDFGTAVRAQLSGGDQVFFAGGQALQLSTGRPDGMGGDGRPAGHWKDDELTGQYIGIMDPTYTPGERGGITANDLAALDYFGYAIVQQSPVIEVLSNDDNSREETLSLDGAMAVTRLLPGRYPCTLQSVRLQLPDASGASPVGKQLRLVVFTDPARAGWPPANPPLLLDRTITIPALPENRMLEVMLPNMPAISAGDIYVGLQTPAGVLLAGDAAD